MDKYEIAQILREIGMLVELTDENPSKGLSYRRAASVIESIPDLNKIVEEKQLESFSGIGESISKMVTQLVKKGSLPYYEKLINLIPQTLLDLTHISGLSLRKIRILYETLNITNLDELEAACKQGQLQKIKGFGPSFVRKLVDRIEKYKSHGYTLLYPQAVNLARALLDILAPYQVKVAGALRRKLEEINQLDFIGLTNAFEECLSSLAKHGLVRSVLKREKQNIQVLLKQGIITHLHLVNDPNQFILDRFILTGSDKHLADFPRKDLNFKKLANEGDIYHAVHLPYIVPELREGFGEIEAAKQGKLPILIEVEDLRGTFHCHTIDSDGGNTIEEMAAAAKKLGWEYLGISDHSKSSYQANGLSEERLLEQIERIRLLNENDSFQLFAGLECDILKDGQLDFPNEILSKLDFVIISIHRYFKMPEKEMTSRLIAAIENPYTTMVGHLTGRLLRHRDPYEVNIPKIIDACIANHKIIELNSYPNRLDMDWRWWIKAKKKGLKCSINPDAHSIRDLKNCQFGIDIARKGWLEKGM